MFRPLRPDLSPAVQHPLVRRLGGGPFARPGPVDGLRRGHPLPQRRLEGRQYQTRQDPTNFAEPFLALCLTQTGDQVMEVVAGLDQKHYVQGPETLFQRKALYSLRVFFRS